MNIANFFIFIFISSYIVAESINLINGKIKFENYFFPKDVFLKSVVFFIFTLLGKIIIFFLYFNGSAKNDILVSFNKLLLILVFFPLIESMAIGGCYYLVKYFFSFYKSRLMKIIGLNFYICTMGVIAFYMHVITLNYVLHFIWYFVPFCYMSYLYAHNMEKSGSFFSIISIIFFHFMGNLGVVSASFVYVYVI